MTIYDELGVRTVINAATTLTVVGGSLMADEVLDAMRSAAGAYVDMHELQAAAGQRIATLTGNEAAYVTSGCAAAMTRSAASSAAVTGSKAAPAALLETVSAERKYGRMASPEASASTWAKATRSRRADCACFVTVLHPTERSRGRIELSSFRA